METLTGTSPLVTLRSWRTVMGSQKTAPASHTLMETHLSPLRWWVTPFLSFTSKHFDAPILRSFLSAPSILHSPQVRCWLPDARCLYKSMFFIRPGPQWASHRRPCPLTSHFTRELHKGPVKKKQARPLHFHQPVPVNGIVRSCTIVADIYLYKCSYWKCICRHTTCHLAGLSIT